MSHLSIDVVCRPSFQHSYNTFRSTHQYERNSVFTRSMLISALRKCEAVSQPVQQCRNGSMSQCRSISNPTPRNLAEGLSTMSTSLEVIFWPSCHAAFESRIDTRWVLNTDSFSRASRCHRHVQLRTRSHLPDERHTGPDHLPLTGKEFGVASAGCTSPVG